MAKNDEYVDIDTDGWDEGTNEFGSFFSWGSDAGQIVYGTVVSFTTDGGEDFNGNECSKTDIKLLAPATSVKKSGDKEGFDKDVLITFNGAPANLEKQLQELLPSRGDLLWVKMTGETKTKKGNTAKNFQVKVKRNSPRQEPKAPEEPPF